MARTARILVRLLGGFTIALWSSVMWAAHWLIGVGDRFAAMNADKLPGTPEWMKLLAGSARFIAEVGEWTMVAVWLLVSLLILWVMRFVSRFLETCTMPDKPDGGNNSHLGSFDVSDSPPSPQPSP